ncbi:MAG: DUF4166 domain-containing protein [Gemmobacter sp.]
MRVAVIGGTGVFGSRLVALLRRDGHDVIACSRGGGDGGLTIDRAGDLGPLWAMGPQAVVDAAGPFHAYGDDPYRLARACIGRGVHYLDLADNAGFCAGIGALDVQARAACVVALSGVSSVPCLSSAVVAALVGGMDEIDTISAAILPGNRAPRGRAVVDSILHQAGRPFAMVVDGRAEQVRGWSSPDWVQLAPGMRRQGWRIEVPDQRVFPAAFGARTVDFRAGLELAAMNRGLAVLSWLRAWAGFGLPGWLVAAMLGAARLLGPFGTDTGGMAVTVTGRVGGAWVRRDWRLVVRRGEGPFVPAVAARATLRDLSAVAPGAGPAVMVLTLAAVEAAMSDLAATVERSEGPVVPLMRRVLGPDFDALAQGVRATHDHAGPRRWSGRASVERGRGWLARAIALAFRFPQATGDVAVTVLKTPDDRGEVWERRFGDRVFRSRLQDGPQGLTERFGPLAFLLALRVGEGALHWPVRRGWCLGVPLPRWLLPVSVAREEEVEGRFRFDVALHAPLGAGLIVRYRGWLTAEDAPVPLRP